MLHIDISREQEMLEKERRILIARAARLEADDEGHATHGEGLLDLREEDLRRSEAQEKDSRA